MPRVAVEWSGNQLSTPVWLKDFINRDNMAVFPARLDPEQFTDQSGVRVQVNDVAGPDVDDESITVDALSGAIPAGTVLYFGADKYARLTAAAAAGDTSIDVEPLTTALADDDAAIYSKFGRRFIPSGTPVGRTYTERDAGDPFGPAIDTDDEVMLLLFDIEDANRNADCELLRPKCGATVAENYLPGWADWDTDLQDLIRSLYNTIVAVP